jgi:hypothetical protein
LAQAAAIFRPGKMTICLTLAGTGCPIPQITAPLGYTVAGSSLQSLPGSVSVIVLSLQAEAAADLPVAVGKVCPDSPKLCTS